MSFTSWLRLIFFPKKSGLYGSARYMGFFEKWAFLSPRHKGFWIGERQRLSEAHSFQNLLLVAPTGMGKTTRFIIPNILTSTGSIIVTDPSGEIFEKTSAYMRKKRGYDILVFNPTDLDHSLKINYLVPFSGSAQKIKQIATILSHHNSGHGDAFWVTQAGNIIYILISALATTKNAGLLNIAEVRKLLNRFGVDKEGLEKFLSEHLSGEMFNEYRAFAKQDTRVLMNALSTARAALDLWSDPDIGALTSEHTVNFDQFRRRKTILYLIVPEHQVHYFSLILNLTYSAFFSACIENGSEEGLPVYFLMDEFANCGEILGFPQIITVSRKRRMPIAIILQDLAQLSAVYGKESAQTIYGGGCGNHLFYAGLDIDTCLKIEHTLGTKTTSDHSGYKERQIATPLHRASDIRLLEDDEYLLISGNKRPIKGKARAYYQVGWMRRVEQISNHV